MDGVFRQNEGIERVALINRVLVVVLELVKCYQVPDCEEYLSNGFSINLYEMKRKACKSETRDRTAVAMSAMI